MALTGTLTYHGRTYNDIYLRLNITSGGKHLGYWQALASVYNSQEDAETELPLFEFDWSIEYVDEYPVPAIYLAIKAEKGLDDA